MKPIKDPEATDNYEEEFVNSKILRDGHYYSSACQCECYDRGSREYDSIFDRLGFRVILIEVLDETDQRS